jgi:hypothetical protein
LLTYYSLFPVVFQGQEIFEKFLERSLFCYTECNIKSFTMDKIKTWLKENWQKALIRSLAIVALGLALVFLKPNLPVRNPESEIPQNTANSTTGNTNPQGNITLPGSTANNPTSNDATQQPADKKGRAEELLKIYNTMLTEKRTQYEEALKQPSKDQEEMTQKLAAIQSELNSLNALISQNCPDIQTNPNPSQECRKWLDQETELAKQISSLTQKYIPKINNNTPPTMSFATERSVSGQIYTFRYDGTGSGTITNKDDTNEAYSVSCTYDTCKLISD